MGEQTPLPWICFRSYGTRSYTHDTCMRPSFSLPCTYDGFVRSVYRHRRVCQGRLYVSPWLNFGIQFKRDGGWTWEARVSPPPKLSTFNLSFIWSSFAAAIHLLYHTCITRWAPTRREDARRCSAYARNGWIDIGKVEQAEAAKATVLPRALRHNVRLETYFRNNRKK